MAGDKVDYDNTVEVARAYPNADQVSGYVALGHLAGPRGSQVRERIIGHLKSGISQGEVDVDGAVYLFRTKGD